MPQGYRRSRGGIAVGRSRAEQQCSGAVFDLRSCRAAAAATVGLHVDPRQRYCTLLVAAGDRAGGFRAAAAADELAGVGNPRKWGTDRVAGGEGRLGEIVRFVVTVGFGRAELDMGLELNRVVFKTDVITVPLD